MGCGTQVLIGLLALLVLGVIVHIFKGGLSSNFNSVDSVATGVAEVKNSDEAKVVKTWRYDEEQDEMTDAMAYWAGLTSDNTEYFDFPYDGGSQLNLWVRKHPKYGTDVIIKITKGQLLCNEYNGTNHVTVRFDDSPAKKYNTVEPTDISSDQLFLLGAKDFISRAKKAKTIKIEIPVFEEGDRVFKFTVDEPLKWEH